MLKPAGMAVETSAGTAAGATAAETAVGLGRSTGWHALRDAAAASVATGMATCRLARQPLRWQAVSKAAAATPSLAPQFDERLDAEGRRMAAATSGKDENKGLAKQLRREEKGASRELRKDAEFLARARDQEKAQGQQARQAERHTNFGWLEEQQASLNLQVMRL
jgi:nucleolar protein 14